MRFARLRFLGLRAVPAALLVGGGLALLSPQVQQVAAAGATGSHLCRERSTVDGSLQLHLTLDSSRTALRLCLTVSDAYGTGLAGVAPEGGVVVASGGQAQALSFPPMDETGQSQLQVAYDAAVGPVQTDVQLQLAGASITTTMVVGG
jgi:hypothetical protein